VDPVRAVVDRGLAGAGAAVDLVPLAVAGPEAFVAGLPVEAVPFAVAGSCS
jgi:hypothetical protein